MNRKTRSAIVSFAVIVAAAGSFALAQTQKDEHPQLPPGWTEADMQACGEAATPGQQHQRLAENLGVWHGKTTMWMTPGAEPMKSECTATITSLYDGRFTKSEISGDMPGMGPFNGFAIYGYDNVMQQFQSSWISNCSTNIMTGTGKMSSDGKTITWQYTHSCPINKKPTTMREIERRTGKDTFTLETHGVDPKSGKEYKMMEIAFTRKPGTSATAAAPTGTR